MITRRTALIHLAAAGTGLFVQRRRALAKASQPSTPVNFSIPADACDCHTHIFGDPARFPFWSGRTYTPETASIAEMKMLHRALHMDRVVIVHPNQLPIWAPDAAVRKTILVENPARLYGF
ncbi:MAG: hypothetical protein AUF76_07165 [Acidobacteria bacterium 13_1_20CM_2_65_9]|nr:MAG: hypothetical protein AUF76_07165 [Acidobacteria bacterium 13_1_20CM_2_65_9]